MASPLESVSAESSEEARRTIAMARRIVIKVGSNVLVGGGDGELDRRVFCGLVESIANLVSVPQRQVVLLTSGAVAVGRRRTGFSRPQGMQETLARRQALAALGQPTLMHHYADEFAFYGIHVAQLLISRDDFGSRDRYINAQNTLDELHSFPSTLPIVNENDTVTTHEITFGDNDLLAGLLTSLTNADALIILSDVDALYERNPVDDPSALPVSSVWADDPGLDLVSGPTQSGSHGTGGMSSKVKAARLAASFGVPTVVAAGRRHDTLGRVLAGESHGTVFIPRSRTLPARKGWIRFASVPQGRIVIDDGAVRALRDKGSSLLPSGIATVRGEFQAGDAVSIVTSRGEGLARGLVAYSSSEIRVLAGAQSSEIATLVQEYRGDAVVHRDDLVLYRDTLLEESDDPSAGSTT
jgi:glutamate 5-kinase